MEYSVQTPVVLLLTLGRLGALQKEIFVTTKELGKLLGVSQQTASKWLQDGETDAYIHRRVTSRGIGITIEANGQRVLKNVLDDLMVLFQMSGRVERLSLKGCLETGLGEGKHYMSLDEYTKPFMKVLGFKPFEGTLNLRIESESITAFQKLMLCTGFVVQGFERTDRVYGKVHLWKCILLLGNKRVLGGIIRPRRTHHGSIIEVIAQKDLRKTYDLKDGDIIDVVVETHIL